MGEVLVTASGKGGTGKTTLCAGVASCLAAGGASVLCIDCDVGLRNLDISLGMSDRAVVTFLDVMQGRCTLADAPAHPKIPSLRLLTAPLLTEPEDLDADAFGTLLAQARQQFDWCLIDAPAGIGAGFRLAARFADRAMVVSTADPASLRDAARTAELLETMGLTGARVAVNRVDPPLFKKMAATIDDVMDKVGLPLLGMVPEDIQVPLAAAMGTPLVLYAKNGAAEACLRIARRLDGVKMPLMRLK